MRTVSVMSLGDARAVMEAARAEAEQAGIETTIAVVDAAGILIILERLDGARLHTPEAATLKARTAAITRMETQKLQEQIRDDVAFLAFPGRLPLTGGLPIVHEGQVVGAIGVSGGTSAQDVAVCRAGLAAFPNG